MTLGEMSEKEIVPVQAWFNERPLNAKYPDHARATAASVSKSFLIFVL